MLDQPIRGTVPEPGLFSLSGLDRARAFLQNRVAGTPHSHLLGYRLTQASAGSAVISHRISPWFEIYDGFVDLSATAEVSIFVAAMTAAPPGVHPRPVTLSLRYLRPCTIDDEAVIARSRVLHAGSHFTTVETLIEDALGRAVAHATGCAVAERIDPAPPPLAHSLDAPADEPVYPGPEPPRRPVPGLARESVLPVFGQFLGAEVIEASSSRVTVTLPASEWFCNATREVAPGILASHGAICGALLILNLVDPSERMVTLDVSNCFLGAVLPDGRPLVASGTLHTRMDDLYVLELETTDADGRRVLTTRGTFLRRKRRPSQAARPSQRVLATILFTDVVGSTERARVIGDSEWQSLLDQHHAVVRRQIVIHGGREVKTLGDGFLVTLESPSRAVQCAMAIRHGVARVGLQIRAGIHTGECEQAGGDISGLAVHVASRVQAAADAGEILVSSTVRDIIAGSDVVLADRGRHELKGLEGEWALSAVIS